MDAAVQLDVQLDVQPKPDTPIKLQIEGIGKLKSRVVHSRLGGMAIEFDIDRDKESHFLAALHRLLSN